LRAPHRANHAFSTVIYLRPLRPYTFIAFLSLFFDVGLPSPGAVDTFGIKNGRATGPLILPAA